MQCNAFCVCLVYFIFYLFYFIFYFIYNVIFYFTFFIFDLIFIFCAQLRASCSSTTCTAKLKVCIDVRVLPRPLHAGVGFATRQVGNRTKPNLIVTADGGTVCLKSQSTFKTTEIKFKLNEAFEETTADDRKTTVSK